MLIAAALLAMLPAVVFAGQNTPSGWYCKPLTTITSSHEDCITSSAYNNGVWDINTKRVAVPTGQLTNRFCVVTLSGEGVHENKDFYVRAKFTKSDSFAKPIGPFGGLSFNMEDADNGNYVMMRLLNKSPANVEIGRLVNKMKNTNEAQTSNTANAAVASGTATLEILVKDGQETVYIDGVVQQEMSDVQPFYVQPGAVGFAFQNAIDWGVKITDAEVCSYCVDDAGNTFLVGESYEDGDKTCTCTAEGGFKCACGDDSACPGGLTRWNDPDTCESKCIRAPAYCSSSGDPHYQTFDGKYYDFHGMCTYQAASCGDFVVNFKNIDFNNGAPRYTLRMELKFKGQTFAIQAGNQQTVDGIAVQVPYIKTYTNGDRVEIINNGQLEILLYNKGRNPSVRLRQTNYGTWISAGMWLHGSCADITEGLCGNWNGDPNDDLIDNSPNTNGEHYKEYDESCPAPPEPYHPCDDVPDGHAEAAKICDSLKGSPFNTCNNVVPVGDADSGPISTCITDVCHCFLDENCACAQFDVYAQQCINNNVDLSNWREQVSFCPYKCPDGQIYNFAGATPVATCLDQNPDKTGTVRGCFCPDGQFLQDEVCVNANQCKCLYEGQFYNNGQEIKKEGECKVCTCEDGGSMSCEDMVCDALSCDDDELEAYKDDICCPYCLAGWVEALNPENTLNKGQSVVLTCEVHVKGVKRKAIAWYKDGEKITDGISKDRLRLTIDNAVGDDSGTYTCEATKDGKTASGDFEVNVVMPVVCKHEDGTTWPEGDIYNPQKTEACTCDAQGEYTCECIDDGEECKDPTPVVWFNDECVKTCVPDFGLCTAAADPFYTTFDGTQFEFKGDCTYNFFGCGDVKMYADHEKDKASTSTKSLEVAFKSDVYKLEGATVTLNGIEVSVPLHKVYKDGSEVQMTDVGTYTFSIVQDGKDPLVYLTWDKVSSYSVKVHGSCKGASTGMCGTWDGDKTNDFTAPDGDVVASAEAFGTAWAEDDETDCPPAPPPPDICADFGLDQEKPVYEEFVNGVLSASPFRECNDVIDSSGFAAEIVQQICGCFGDEACSCALFEQYAQECNAKGIDTDGWQLKNGKVSEHCKPACPEGSVFRDKGPKPAPTCYKPKGGKRKQPGCFCPDGQILDDEKCIDVGDCQCEYAGERYDVGKKFDKPAECLTCECIGVGEDECEAQTCKTKCKADEVEVEVDDECCPQCLANWVEAVNPKPADVELKKPLSLTCKVTGVEVTKDDVKWIRFNPGNFDITKIKKRFTVSDDGLTLTINEVDAKKLGDYKCVVEKDGKTSEGTFEVALPVEEDLVEAVKETVDGIVGGNVELQCNKLKKVPMIWWECNGIEMENGVDNVQIKWTPKYSRLNFNPATLKDTGTCTCHAKTGGAEDSVDIKVEVAEPVEEDLVEAVKETVDGVVGEYVELQCNKLKTVPIIWWECNGIEMENGVDNVKIKWTKKYSRLSFNPATLKDKGTCTCHAKTGTAEDTADIKVEIIAEPAEEDLVEAAQETVAFIEGGDVELQCNILKPVDLIWWECNGDEMESGVFNVKIKKTKKYSRLNLKPATLDDKGTCTCHAKAGTAQDSADIKVGGAENKVDITRKETEVNCQQGDGKGKNACMLQFTVTAEIGNVRANDVRICKFNEAKLTSCKNSKLNKGIYSLSFGKQRKPGASGNYVAVVTVLGKEYTSEPITLTVAKKVKGGKKKKEIV